jgi:hypothetical protein
MSEIMPESNRFGKVFIQTQSSSHGSGYLTDFQSVSEASTIMVPLRRQKNLGFIFQTSKGLTMQNTITVDLKNSTNRAGLFSNVPTL